MAEHDFERLQCPIDEPLIVVLDNDDLYSDSDTNNDDDDDNDEVIATVEPNVVESEKVVPKPIENSVKKPVAQSRRPTNSKRAKSSRFATTSSSSNAESIISTLQFEDKINVLTVSRTGSTYYCLEDLYEKVFRSLCTIDELIELLERSALVLVKQMTLSEKIAVEEKMTHLKSTQTNVRPRLLSINALDYLKKLKNLLIDQHKYRELEKLMQTFDKPLVKIAPKKRTTMENDSISPPKRIKIKKKIVSPPKSTRSSSDDQSKILSSGNILSMQKPPIEESEDSNESIGMPKIVSVEENVQMNEHSSPTIFSIGRSSTDSESSVFSTKEETDGNLSEILLTINRQPIRSYSFHSNSSSPNEEFDVSSSSTSASISKTMNLISNMINAPVSVNETSASFEEALADHCFDNPSQLPKLLIRQTKSYSRRTIDTAGQIFPTWLAPPHFRCVHCFNCDQVFSPQLFMRHTDDPQLINEKPLSMSRIELLKSERLSNEKVKSWNEFCQTLTQYAKAHYQREKNMSKKLLNCLSEEK